MSKQSYVEGFCKAAEAQGVDPYALYELVVPMRKEAQSEKTAQAKAQTGSTLDSLNGWIDKAKSWWNNDLNQWQRDLLSLGGGALAGHTVNRLLGGEGAGGLIAGGLTGLAASSFDWKGLSDALSKKRETQTAKG